MQYPSRVGLELDLCRLRRCRPGRWWCRAGMNRAADRRPSAGLPGSGQGGHPARAPVRPGLQAEGMALAPLSTADRLTTFDPGRVVGTVPVRTVAGAVAASAPAAPSARPNPARGLGGQGCADPGPARAGVGCGA